MKRPILLSPSPNFNDRKCDVDMLVLHYTGMRDGYAALERLRDLNAPRVSAHYLVEEDGRVFSLVPEALRAWHAGVSRWRGRDDINSRSIGIEIVNGGHDFGLPPFPDSQIDSVIDLARQICDRWRIPPWGVVGHSDIAPDRKQDPGEQFPWRRLAEAGVGLWPKALFPSTGGLPSVLTDRPDRASEFETLQTNLRAIGYDVSPSGVADSTTISAIAAFQRRWRPSQVSGVADTETTFLVSEVARLCA
jgi:N-acetylmuramoyl-L-alanine amidase